ncbi:MAG TPA: glycoside hydrolase family 36 N-terminal domain-containing protein, partial [Candidatus Acidoferrum sp.]|nr:glycoside hydrolase family 36 N-terminal domain-containing protein [Candidatus Acidoferrum sp.]
MNATKMIVSFRIAIALTVAILWAACSTSYAAPAGVGQMFRLDGGDATYVFGVNERGELQALYWGGKLAPSDKNAAAHSLPEMASFDSPGTTTPQEYAAWGAGLFTEPALKITFADGNRDLVLHFVSSKSSAGSHEILMKDISREIYVTLRYAIDQESGILARSAVIENREK